MKDQMARDLIDRLHMEIIHLDSENTSLRIRYTWDTVRSDEFDALLDYLNLERKQIEKHVEFVPREE